jgi:HEAT repeat
MEHTFQHTSARDISQTLVTLALHDADWKKVEKYCLEFLEHPDASVRAVAATCIGHLARIHKTLDLDLVLPALYRHLSDPGKWVAGNADNALSDIEIFMKVSVQRMKSKQNEEDNVEWEIDEDEEDEK